MAKTAAVKASKKPLKKRIWDQRYLFLLMIPAIIWVAVICYAPMTGLYMAFTNYAPSTKGYFHDLLSAPFVGLEWFQYFFENDFKMIMRNTMATSLLTLLFSFPAPIIIAILLNEVRSTKAKKFVQTASYLPYFISWVIASNIFLTFLSGDGLINKILLALHVTDEPIFSSRKVPTSGGSSPWQTPGRTWVTMLLFIWQLFLVLMQSFTKQQKWMEPTVFSGSGISLFRLFVPRLVSF